jgi:hypothetical protein
MNNMQQMIKQAAAGWSVALVAMSLSLGAVSVLAQTTGDNRQGTPAPAAAAINAATAQSRETQRTAIESALLPYTPVTIVVTPAVGPAVAAPALPSGPTTAVLAPATPVTAAAPVPAAAVAPRPMAPAAVIPDTGAADAVRIMRVPAACTPKTNSLDCVQDSTQPGQGANVEGRVRNSVMGEVGTGKATTEGGGGAKRQQACTPKPGELTCTP